MADYDPYYDEDYYDEDEYYDDDDYGHEFDQPVTHYTRTHYYGDDVEDPDYATFAQGSQYWDRFNGRQGEPANDGEADKQQQNWIRPHHDAGDGYFKDHRHHLTHREEMRALELDPHHFYEVKPEPPQFHHEMPYFADPNKPFYGQGDGQQSN